MAGFRNKRQEKWIAWLALVAVWLTIAMPVISRSMPDGMTSMGFGAWCTGRGLSDHQRQAPSDPSAPTDRCGYCSLFCHSPFIGGHAHLALAPAPFAAQSPVASTVPSGPDPRLLSARARGPPSLA